MPSAIPEARVPCPLCGGLVHPVAGRCKHCRSDLSGRRTGRPAAAAPLPALAGSEPASGKPTKPVLPAAPILPARRDRYDPPPPAPRTSWQRWPIIVIALAVVAIVLAAAVLAWPVGDTHHGEAHAATPPSPAPEAMNTQPLPTPHADPWATPAAPQDSTDMQNDPSAPSGLTSNDFLTLFGRHLCDRHTVCGTSNTVIKSYCALWSAMPAPPAQTATCPAAKRCFARIDKLECTMQADDASALNTLITQLPDCFEAMTAC